MRYKKKSKDTSSTNTKSRQKVKKLISTFKKKFGLGDFRFCLVFVRGTRVSDYYAEVVMRGNNVRIYFNEDLMDERPSSIKDTVVHELLHVVMYRLVDRAYRLIRKYRGTESEKRRIERRLEKLEHGIIDRIVPVILRER